MTEIFSIFLASAGNRIEKIGFEAWPPAATLVLEGYGNWQPDGLENRCPQGLVGSSPTPSALVPGGSVRCYLIDILSTKLTFREAAS